MKFFEKILWAAFLVGLLFKWMHWPLAGVLLILSLSTVAILYWLGVTWFGTPTRKDQKTVLSILAGIAFSIATLGILFKFQYWPMTGFYLLIGTATCTVIAIVAFASMRTNEALRPYLRGLLWRAAILGIMAFILYNTPARTLLTLQYPNDPQRVDLLDSLYAHGTDDSTRERSFQRLQEMNEAELREETGPDRD